MADDCGGLRGGWLGETVVAFGDDGGAIPRAAGKRAGVEGNFTDIGEFGFDVRHVDGVFTAAVRARAVMVAAESSAVWLGAEGGALEAGGEEFQPVFSGGGTVSPYSCASVIGSGVPSGGSLGKGNALEGDDEWDAVVERGELVRGECAPGPIAIGTCGVAAVAAAVALQGAGGGEGEVVAGRTGGGRAGISGVGVRGHWSEVVVSRYRTARRWAEWRTVRRNLLSLEVTLCAASTSGCRSATVCGTVYRALRPAAVRRASSRGSTAGGGATGISGTRAVVAALSSRVAIALGGAAAAARGFRAGDGAARSSAVVVAPLTLTLTLT